MAFELRQEDLGDGAHLIEASGEIDRLEAPQLQAAFDAAIRAGASRVVVDLAAVEFFDSTVLGTLLAGARRLAKSGGETVVVSAPAARRSLEIKGVDALVRVVDSRDQALP